MSDNFRCESPQLKCKDICGPSDNPHELLSLKCKKCFKSQSDSRQVFQDRGWRLFCDESFPEHDGFAVCQECTGFHYAWSDLY